jgi:MSHA biogenesis protein MshN
VINRPPAETVKNYAQMTPEERDTLAVQYALRLIQDNNTMQAYASLEEHVMQNRYAHQSRETYAKLLVNDGNLLAARNLVESGLQLAPNHPGFKKVKARILIGNGDSAEAVSVLSSRAPPVHEDIEYHELLATAQLASRDFEGAQLSYTSLVRQDQSQGRWWYGLAASNDSLGNRQAALQAYTRAAAQNNLSPNLRRRVQERLAVLGQ